MWFGGMTDRRSGSTPKRSTARSENPCPCSTTAAGRCGQRPLGRTSSSRPDPLSRGASRGIAGWSRSRRTLAPKSIPSRSPPCLAARMDSPRQENCPRRTASTARGKASVASKAANGSVGCCPTGRGARPYRVPRIPTPLRSVGACRPTHSTSSHRSKTRTRQDVHPLSTNMKRSGSAGTIGTRGRSRTPGTGSW